MRHVPYVALALCLVAFGVLGIFSIGFPFLATGLVMLFLLPLRPSFDVLVPAIAAVSGFTAAFLLVAPLGCTASAGAPAGGRAVGVTICNGVFSNYVGRGVYNPPLLPAFLVGLIGGVVAAVVARSVIRRRSARLAASV
ncbi:MAG: hypothetical protein ACJ76P_04375 [Actinomycetota bacterium]